MTVASGWSLAAMVPFFMSMNSGRVAKFGLMDEGRVLDAGSVILGGHYGPETGPFWHYNGTEGPWQGSIFQYFYVCYNMRIGIPAGSEVGFRAGVNTPAGFRPTWF
jgi:hypothetical protein